MRSILNVLIGLNLITLSLFFAWPRWDYVQKTVLMTPEARMEREGSSDMPNQFVLSYQAASRLEKLTPDDAVLFLPSGDDKGSMRAPFTQRLYPRRLIFENDPDWEVQLNKDWKGLQTLLVFRKPESARHCRGKESILKGVPDYWICRM